MPKYRYTVINPDNKELTGTISTPDEKNAREELNHLGFSILKLEEIAESGEKEAGSDQAKFGFSALDKNNKRVTGTIQAQDRYGAYKRLVKEYSFRVDYIVSAALDENAQQEEKLKGVFELQNRLDEEELQQKKIETASDFNLEEFRQKQGILLTQVEFVLGKVREILNLYGSEIKPETKDNIRLQVDKILRIKNSTNLDYIRKSCEELLIFLQKEEIFLHEEMKQKERTQLSLQAQSILMQLHERNHPERLSLRTRLEEWRKKHILENSDPGAFEYFLNFWLNYIIGSTEELEELRESRKSLAEVEGKLKEYGKLYLKAQDPNMRGEVKTHLRDLWRNRRQLKRKIKELKKLGRQLRKKNPKESIGERFSHELLALSGWLLTFYLAYYFCSNLVIQKGLFPNPGYNLSIYKSIFIKYFLSVLFLLHASLYLKVNYFRRNEIAGLIIAPLFLISSLLIIFNL